MSECLCVFSIFIKWIEVFKLVALVFTFKLVKRLEDFKEKLLNKKPQTPAEYKEAARAHARAQIDQGLRNKLEKALKVSEACFDDIMEMIEEYING